jgi:hypothetical protein
MENRTNHVLTIGFAVLLFVNIGYLLLGFASIPRYYERVTTLTIQPYDVPAANYPTNESVQQSAAEHGMTLSQYAVEQIVFNSALVLLFMAVAVLIVSRARWNWFAWFSAFFLVFIAEFAFYDQVYVARLVPLWFYNVGALFWPLILLYLFLFRTASPCHAARCGWSRRSWCFIAVQVVPSSCSSIVIWQHRKRLMAWSKLLKQ